MFFKTGNHKSISRYVQDISMSRYTRIQAEEKEEVQDERIKSI